MNNIWLWALLGTSAVVIVFDRIKIKEYEDRLRNLTDRDLQQWQQQASDYQNQWQQQRIPNKFM